MLRSTLTMTRVGIDVCGTMPAWARGVRHRFRTAPTLAKYEHQWTYTQSLLVTNQPTMLLQPGCGQEDYCPSLVQQQRAPQGARRDSEASLVSAPGRTRRLGVHGPGLVTGI